LLFGIISAMESVLICSTKLRHRKATAIIGMYAAFDIGRRTVHAVWKRKDDKIIKHSNYTRIVESIRCHHILITFIGQKTP
jgi:membrane protein DedA with SNARE-associated domain